MSNVRRKGLEDFPQAGRNISFSQVMLLAHHTDFVDQACDTLDFVHDEVPFFFVLLHLLSIPW
jgi:hypothetical protein